MFAVFVDGFRSRMAALFSLLAVGLAACEDGTVTSSGRQVALPPGWTCPKVGSDYGSSFGVGGYGGRGDPHTGLDIVGARGHPVIAAADGEVVGTGREDTGGNWVALLHTPPQVNGPTHLVTYYYHLDEIRPGLRDGDKVSRGEFLGRLGADGDGAGDIPHLHFETWVSPGGRTRLRISPNGRESLIQVPGGHHINPNDTWSSGPGTTAEILVVEPFSPNPARPPRGLTWPVVCDAAQ